MRSTGWLPLKTGDLLKESRETIGSQEFKVLRSPGDVPHSIRATFDDVLGFAQFELRYPFDEPGIVVEADGAEVEVGRRSAKLLRIKVPIPSGLQITPETLRSVIAPAINEALEAFVRKPKRWLVRRDNMKVVQQAIYSGNFSASAAGEVAYAP